MKSLLTVVFLLFASIVFGAAKPHTSCMALAPNETELASTQEKLCLTTYTTAGIPVGNFDIAYYGKEKALPGLKPRHAPFATLSYRRIYTIEEEGKLSLILIERNDSPFTESFNQVRVVVFQKTKVDGSGREIGKISVGPDELSGMTFYYQQQN